MVDLLRQSTYQQQQVTHGQTKEVVVGDRVHVAVPRDHDAGADVAREPQEQDERVEGGERSRHVDVAPRAPFRRGAPVEEVLGVEAGADRNGDDHVLRGDGPSSATWCAVEARVHDTPGTL